MGFSFRRALKYFELSSSREVFSDIFVCENVPVSKLKNNFSESCFDGPKPRKNDKLIK